MVPIYVSTLLPVFCHTFHSSMIPSVKRASLGLVKKIVHYMDKNLLDATSNTDVAGQVFFRGKHLKKIILPVTEFSMNLRGRLTTHEL